jgi:isopenicillin N synthase-like dioxygenase
MSVALEAARVSPATLPIIDIGGLWSERLADRQAVGVRLRHACLDKGFFYIRNHSIADDLVHAVFAEAEAFSRFALPTRRPSTRRVPRRTAVTRRSRVRRSKPALRRT